MDDIIASTDAFQVTDTLPGDQSEETTEQTTEASDETTQETEEKSEETAAETKPPEEKTSKKLATLARREKRLLEKENELKALASRASKYEETLASIKQNPVDFLQSAGISIEDLTNFLLTQQPIEQKPEDKITQLENKLNQMEEEKIREEQESIVRQQQHLVNQFRNDLESFIESNKSTYEYLSNNKATSIVMDVISDHANQTGKIMSNEEACQLVEQEFRRIAGVSPVNKSSAGDNKQHQNGEAPGSELAKDKTTSTTLSNDLIAQPTSKEMRELSDQEREERAILHLQKLWN